MERMYIIGGAEWQSFAERHQAILLSFPKEDKHDFIAARFNTPIKIVIIDIGVNTASALEIAMHIRLSIEQIHSSVLCPIVFATDLSKDAFLNNGYYSQLFLTDGVYLCPASKLEERIGLFMPIGAKDYKKAFLNKINIPPKKGFNHSLANQWGASIMSRFVPGGLELEEIRPIKKDLYFKYISACATEDLSSLFLDENTSQVFEDSIQIDATGKRILIIDDEADKGWESVLKKLLASAEEIATIKEKVPNFKTMTDEAKIHFLSPWDLFILDLRLDGDAEEGIYNTDEFSGAQILRLIKALNRGNQVIMFTASNKAWNYKALLNAGADGYYIKESPEFMFSREFSMANLNSFKKDVERCFSRGYLRDFFLFKKSIVPEDKDRIDKQRKRFLNETQNQLSMAFDLADVARTNLMFSHAFVSAFQTLEILKNYYCPSTFKAVPIMENKEFPYNRALANDGSSDIVAESKIDSEENLFNKLSSIYLQIKGEKDDGVLFLLSQLIRIRNAFIHKKKRLSGTVITQADFESRFCQDASVISEPVRTVMYDLIEKKYLIEYWDTWRNRNSIGIKADIISNKTGLELVLFCLKRFYND